MIRFPGIIFIKNSRCGHRSYSGCPNNPPGQVSGPVSTPSCLPTTAEPRSGADPNVRWGKCQALFRPLHACLPAWNREPEPTQPPARASAEPYSNLSRLPADVPLTLFPRNPHRGNDTVDHSREKERYPQQSKLEVSQKNNQPLDRECGAEQ